MDQNFKTELADLTRALRGWVKYQGDLGVRGFPRGEVNPGDEEDMPIGAKLLTLEDVRKELGDCKACISLCEGRNKIVFGEGAEDADLMFIGEAPGADEDCQGRPFVGRAGQLLTKIISAMKLERENVYIANVLKCRPPKNRDPNPDEAEACEPILIKQIQVIKPKVIVALGKISTQLLLKTKSPIGALRGKFHDYHGIPLMPTYHPAALLRDPSRKKTVWDDMKLVMAKLGKELD